MFDEVNAYQSDLPYVHGAVGDGDAPANGPGTSNLYVNSPSLQQLASGWQMRFSAGDRS